MSDRQQNVSRRQAVAGAGTAAALAAAAAMLPARREAALEAARVPAAASPGTGGYRETEHVLRYYRTTRV